MDCGTNAWAVVVISTAIQAESFASRLFVIAEAIIKSVVSSIDVISVNALGRLCIVNGVALRWPWMESHMGVFSNGVVVLIEAMLRHTCQ